MPKGYGKFLIRADGLEGKKAAEYENTVANMLLALDTIGPSHALLDGFRCYNRQVVVVPYDGSAGECNALGDGFGFTGEVSFTPRQWFAKSTCVKDLDPGAAGASAHEVLVHELVHAFRGVAGTFHSVSLPKEEEIAVLVTNIFSSRTNRPLRQDHESFDPQTDPVLSTSVGFLNANRALIEKFAKEHPDVTRWLARVEAPFNPLQAYWSQVPVSRGGWGAQDMLPRGKSH
jgi:hypothetical protein